MASLVQGRFYYRMTYLDEEMTIPRYAALRVYRTQSERRRGGPPVLPGRRELSGGPRASGLLAPDLMLPVREDYQTYTPPRWAKRTVCELLESLSVEHVGGLSSIVLTESAQIRNGKTRRIAGRKYAMKECLGFYRRRLPGGAAGHLSDRGQYHRD